MNTFGKAKVFNVFRSCSTAFKQRSGDAWKAVWGGRGSASLWMTVSNTFEDGEDG
jgi:hypothetical protein